MIIYKATGPTGKVYIGQTIQGLEIRKQQHRRYAKEGNSYFAKAIRKHKFENFNFEILCETDSKEKLDILEKFYIACYKKMTDIYNLTDGGEGLTGYNFTEEHRKNIGLSSKGRNIGYKHNKESIQKIIESKKGENNPMYGLSGKKSPTFKSGISTERIVEIYEKGVARLQIAKTLNCSWNTINRRLKKYYDK